MAANLHIYSDKLNDIGDKSTWRWLQIHRNCWCWPSVLTWQVSSLFHLQYVHRKLKQTLVTCGLQRSRVCLNFLWLYGRSNKLETCQVFLVLICLKNNIFCVYSCSELMQVKFVTKFNTEAQIDLPKKQLEGWLRWWMNDIYCIYNFVEGVNVFFGRIKFVIFIWSSLIVISDQFHFIIFEIVSLYFTECQLYFSFIRLWSLYVLKKKDSSLSQFVPR